MMAITDGLMLRAWRSTSRPSRAGMRASDTTRSKGRVFRNSMAARPFSATTTSCPSRLSRMASISRIERSSSTTRMRADSLTVAVRSAVTVPAMSGVLPRAVGDRPLVRGICFSHGQRHLHAGAFSLLRGHADFAAVGARNPVAAGQAEAGAVREAAPERLEDAVDVLGRDAHPFVVDAEDHLAVAAAAGRRRPRPPPELAPGGHGAQAVRLEVPDDLPDLRFVRAIHDGLLRHGHDDRVRPGDLGAVLEQAGGVGQDLPQGPAPPPRRARRG